MAPSHRSPFPTLLFTIFTLIHLTSAQTCPPEGPAPDCSLEGQTDFYGLGVRMGIYFTWLTSWIANNFLASEVGGSLDTNAVFLLAIFVTMMFNSIWRQLRMVDALVLLHLCYGFLFGVMSLWGYRTMYYHRMGAKGRSHFGGFGTHLRLVLMTAISGYAVWFWFEGLDDGLIGCNQRDLCGGLESFFFVKVKLQGWYRTLFKVGAIGCVLYYGIMCIVAIAGLSVRLFRFFKNGLSGWRGNNDDEDFEDTGLNQRQLTYAYIALATFNLFWMIWAAVTVEMTLNYNHFTGVLGENGLSAPGQQIPLLIGLFSFVRIMYLIYKEYYLERHESTKETRGLGIRKSGPGTSVEAAPVPHPPEQHTHLNSIPLMARSGDRSLAYKMLVAWLPWLTDFRSFRTPRTDNGLGIEPMKANGGAAVEMHQTTKSTGVDIDVESLGSRKAGQEQSGEMKL